MNRDLYREIWATRFEKMASLEKEAVEAYKVLLKDCRRLHTGHPMEAVLERLIADETRHIALVAQLSAILARQK